MCVHPTQFALAGLFVQCCVGVLISGNALGTGGSGMAVQCLVAVPCRNCQVYTQNHKMLGIGILNLLSACALI